MSVGKKGKITAKKKGTAKIQITVTGKNKKKKSTWVKIQVADSGLVSQPKPQPVPEPDPGPAPERSKVLVAYFSATNTTERIAGLLADELSADLYEIVPEIPYTSADLNYGDSSSRTSVEMNDPYARPAISGSVTDIAQYDIIFLGYPIWWGKEPMIIRTFLESYNLKGKKIVPFCTSGGSGISGSMKGIKASAKGAKIVKGRDLTDLSSKKVAKWAKSKVK